MIDVDEVPARAFGLAAELEPGVFDWHAHERHQLLYASQGSLLLRTDEAQWLLAVGRAAWIRAGVAHQVEVPDGASLRTVYVAPEVPGTPEVSCAVFGMRPVAREMVCYAMRWDHERALRAGEAEVAGVFFEALVRLCRAWIEEEDVRRYALPVARSGELERAMRYALEHLDTATIEDAAASAFVSSRTLARRFRDEADMTWRQFLSTARMLHAMQRLLEPGVSVSEVAVAVGFDSLSAFSQAFKRFTFELPSAYQQSHARPTS